MLPHPRCTAGAAASARRACPQLRRQPRLAADRRVRAPGRSAARAPLGRPTDRRTGKGACHWRGRHQLLTIVFDPHIFCGTSDSSQEVLRGQPGIAHGGLKVQVDQNGAPLVRGGPGHRPKQHLRHLMRFKVAASVAVEFAEGSMHAPFICHEVVRQHGHGLVRGVTAGASLHDLAHLLD
eukprot:scaffold1744_cov340-Prasinococcus_capsulatus_cf.AAC.14